jgi:hypothetical protein
MERGDLRGIPGQKMTVYGEEGKRNIERRSVIFTLIHHSLLDCLN